MADSSSFTLSVEEDVVSSSDAVGSVVLNLFLAMDRTTLDLDLTLEKVLKLGADSVVVD